MKLFSLHCRRRCHRHLFSRFLILNSNGKYNNGHLSMWTTIFLLVIVFGGGQHFGTESRRTEGCHFPQEWEGIWFQSTVRPYLTIDARQMSSKGNCVEAAGEKFVLKSAKNCFKCMVFHQKHKNVLQYKETLGCSSDSDLASLCGLIAGDANLYTLFRVDSSPITCPFHGPFTFSYNNGKGDCKYPESELEPCTDPSRLVFHYQACPNVPGSELKAEELECQATWRDGSQHYLVGKLSHRHAVGDEDKYRCFVFEYLSPANPAEGLRLAQSGDATCNGLLSPREGSRTLTLTKGQSKIGCTFPAWLSAHKEWSSLNGETRILFGGGNSTSTASASKFRWVNSTTVSLEPSSHFLSNSGTSSTSMSSSYVVRKESSVVCHKILKLSAQQQQQPHITTRIILYQSSGCKSGFVCADISRKTENVIKIRLGSMTRTIEYACDESQFQHDTSHLLLAATLDRTASAPAIPLSGLYRISPANLTSTSNFRERASTSLFEGRQQLYHQQLSAAVRAGQQLKAVDDEEQLELSSKNVEFDDFCVDGKTRKVVSLVAGCRQPFKDDMQIRSSCEEDMTKAYSCTHAWREHSEAEDEAETEARQEDYHLIFRSKVRSVSTIPDNERICIRVSISDDNESSGRINSPAGDVSKHPEKVIITRLDENCQSSPSQKSKQALNSIGPDSRPKSERFTLKLEGDCSTVSGSSRSTEVRTWTNLVGLLLLGQLLVRRSRDL